MEEYALDEPARRIGHGLAPHFSALAAIPTRAALRASDFYRAHGDELEAAVAGVEWDNSLSAAGPAGGLRLAAWNIERGKELEGIIDCLRGDPVLRGADVLLLTEADIGMGRSFNRNVPRLVAEALGLNYAFANSFLELGEGDAGERGHGRPNEVGLHGNAVLSRYPFKRLRAAWLPWAKDYFYGAEKRLGRRRVLVATCEVGGRECDFAVTHLDFNSSPRQRRAQLGAALDALPAGDWPQLVGGDWNTSTYDLSSARGLAANLFFKFAFLGVEQTVAHYMAPDLLFEKPLFALLERRGFSCRPYNDLSHGTLHYDVEAPVDAAKTRQFVPGFVWRWLRRRLEPWGGCVPIRLDWLAGRLFEPVAPATLPLPRRGGKAVSDHGAVAVGLRLPGEGG